MFVTKLKVLTILTSFVLLLGCDTASQGIDEDTVSISLESSIAEYINQVNSDYISDLQLRVADLDHEDIARLELLINKAERLAVGEHMWEGRIMEAEVIADVLQNEIDRMMPVDNQVNLLGLIEKMVADHPVLAGKSKEQISVLLRKEWLESRPLLETSCEGACAAAAALEITAIEAGFVGAAIVCSAANLAYGVCIGAALIAKNALIGRAGIGLAKCVDACKE